MTDLPQWAVRRGMNLWSDIKEDCPHPSRDLDLLDETAPYLIARALADAAKPDEVMRQALEDILNPIEHLRRYAEIRGSQLSGAAYVIANDIGFIQQIARDALKKPPAAPEVE